MKILSVYPGNAKKLYYQKPGQVIQFCLNDGKVDNDFYMVTNWFDINSRNVISLTTGIVVTRSVSCRCVWFPEATMVPDGLEEESLLSSARYSNNHKTENLPCLTANDLILDTVMNN